MAVKIAENSLWALVVQVTWKTRLDPKNTPRDRFTIPNLEANNFCLKFSGECNGDHESSLWSWLALWLDGIRFSQGSWQLKVNIHKIVSNSQRYTQERPRYKKFNSLSQVSYPWFWSWLIKIEHINAHRCRIQIRPRLVRTYLNCQIRTRLVDLFELQHILKYHAQ